MLSTSTSFGGLRRRQKITSDIIFYLYSVLFKLYLYCVKVRLNILKCLWSWGKPIDNQDCYYSMDNFRTTNILIFILYTHRRGILLYFFVLSELPDDDNCDETHQSHHCYDGDYDSPHWHGILLAGDSLHTPHFLQLNLVFIELLAGVDGDAASPAVFAIVQVVTPTAVNFGRRDEDGLRQIDVDVSWRLRDGQDCFFSISVLQHQGSIASGVQFCMMIEDLSVGVYDVSQGKYVYEASHVSY